MGLLIALLELIAAIAEGVAFLFVASTLLYILFYVLVIGGAIIFIWWLVDREQQRRKKAEEEERWKEIAEQNRIAFLNRQREQVFSFLKTYTTVPETELQWVLDSGGEITDLWDYFVGRMAGNSDTVLGERVTLPGYYDQFEAQAREITPLLEAAGRSFYVPVCLPEALRARHVYIVGRSGYGKTTFIRKMLLQDLEHGRGVGVLAPEAELIEEDILPFIPKGRIDDVFYVNPADTEFPLSLNPLYLDPNEDLDLKIDETSTILKRVIGEQGTGPRMEEILRQTLYALIPFPETTLLDVPRFLSREDDGFRREVLAEIGDEAASAFFLGKYPSFPKDAHVPIENRLSKFTRSAKIRALLCSRGPALSFRRMMDEGKIFLVNLNDGILGTQSAQVIGQLVVTKLQLAAMSRADIPQERRRPFTVYLDEFQAFTDAAEQSYEAILSRARKYKLSLVLAHQQTGQISPSLLKEILGNVSTVVSFLVGAEDARKLSNEFAGSLPIRPEAFLNLSLGETWVRMGKSIFPMKTFLPSEKPDPRIREAVIAASRRKALQRGGIREEVPKEETPGEEEPWRPPRGLDLPKGPEGTSPNGSPATGRKQKSDDPRKWIDKTEPNTIWGGTEDDPDDDDERGS